MIYHPLLQQQKEESKKHTITVFDIENNKVQSIEVQENNIDDAIKQANLFVRMSLNRNHFVREKYWTSVLDKLQALKKEIVDKESKTECTEEEEERKAREDWYSRYMD